MEIIGAKAEIHFHEQKRASVFLESGAWGNHEILAEIAVLLALGIRILSNLGKCEYADNLASALLNASDLFPSFSLTGIGGVEIVPYPGYAGRKVFNTTIEFTGDAFTSKVTSSGFGWLNVGYGAYAPIAVLTFLRFLVLKRGRNPATNRDDLLFTMRIDHACGLVGQLYCAGHISPFANHHQFVIDVLAASCADYFESTESS